MRITIYDNGEVFVPDKLIGFVGETEREIDFTFTNITGADGYKLRIMYSDDLIYDIPIVNKKAAIDPSVLREAGRVKAQWIAYAADGDTYTLVSKSEMFDLLIGESIEDEITPIPTYEQIMNACEELIEEGMTKEQIITAIEQIIRTGEVEDLDTGFVTTLKEINHGVGFRVWIGSSAEYEQIDPKENNVLYIRRDDPTAETINQLVENTADSGWQTMELSEAASYDSANTRPKYRKIGHVVYLKGNCNVYLSAMEEIFGYLPENYRPTVSCNFQIGGIAKSFQGPIYPVIRISASGVLATNRIWDLGEAETKSSGTVLLYLDGISFVVD